jgi:hypothetical protein
VADDEGRVTRLREVLGGEPDVDERRMFGGLVFMVAGHMAIGTRDDRLLVRAGTDDVLDEPGVRPMEQRDGGRAGSTSPSTSCATCRRSSYSAGEPPSM